MTLYGIKNCATVRKARRWLTDQNIEYTFHELRDDGVDKHQLTVWVDELGWEVLLNKRSTTWRKLAAKIKENIDRQSAIEIMLEYPTIIKRPILDSGDKHIIGFSEKSYRVLCSAP